LGRDRGGDLGYDGPSVVLASSFEVEILPPVSPSKVGPNPAEGGNDAEGAAAPSVDVCTCRDSLSLVCICFLRPLRPKHIIVVL
jgi:hypothetical protein